VGKNVVPWAFGGVAVLALLGVIVFQRYESGAAPAASAAAPFPAGAAAPGGPVGDPSQIDIASMSPRERADRLYERVMRTASGGDSAQARTFLPMALAAYQMVPDVDVDARYHIGVLSLMAGDPSTALAQADTILSAQPDHLFGLYNAAQAEQTMGDAAKAKQLYQHLLSAYDKEVAKALPEYQEHSPLLPVLKQDASRAVDSL
jgi:tetratricopeptide (TPR) repeat protein